MELAAILVFKLERLLNNGAINLLRVFLHFHNVYLV